jgi:uncharacterized protein (DUF58 family)
MDSTDEFLKKVRAIDLKTRKLLKEGLANQYLSAFRGSGMQFREFRKYVYGDDIRHISWTMSAKTEDPVIKLFEEERDRTFMLVVDASGSIRRGGWAKEKADRAAEIAGTLALSAAESNDLVGLLLFTDRVETLLVPSKGRNHMLRIIREILAFNPEGRGTDPNHALQSLYPFLKKQSIVFFISDMEKIPDHRLIQRFAKKHEFVAIQIENPKEWELPKGAFLELESSESGRPVTVDSNSSSISSYLKTFYEGRESIAENEFHRRNIDFLKISTQEDYIIRLRNFFRSRSGRGRR